MSSATNAGVTFPPSCNRARPHLLLFSLYAMGAGTLLVFRPAVILDLPLFKPIERLTGLPHLPTPTTLEGRQFLAVTGIVTAAVGLIYGLEAGPWWEYGGKAFAQISIDGRLIFAASSFALSFLTPYGSSFLVGVAFGDAMIALLTQKMLGSRKELTGRPWTPSESKEEEHEKMKK